MGIGSMYMFDNNIYAFLLLSILLAIVLIKKDIFDYSRTLFFRMILFNMVILIVEILAWAFDGIATDMGFAMNYIFNVLLILMEPIMAAFWLSYVDYKIHDSQERLKKRIFYLHGFVFAFILIVINFFKPVAFVLDDENIYHRGGYLWLSLLVVFGLVLYTIVLVYKNRKVLSDRMVKFVAVFALLPVLVSFIQLFVYGLILTWAVVALGIVFAYYMIEISGNSEDYLTGLYSRKKMEEILIGFLEKKQSVSVIMIDLENFKKVNDTYGHKIGDETLVTFSKLLLQVFKSDFHISRIGGDEFLLISKNESEYDLKDYKSQLVTNMKESNYKYFEDVGVSFGAKTFEYNDQVNMDTILDTVDELMYNDKSKNKNLKEEKQIHSFVLKKIITYERLIL